MEKIINEENKMRLIDADKAISDYAHYGISHPYDACDLEDILNECSTIEAIPKDQYENRLKADMVSMLTDIQLEIEKLQGKYSPYYDEASQHISEVIQQKIEQLKENKKH